MQTYLNKYNKIIIETRHELRANKTDFAILSLSSKKFYPKPFSNRLNGNTLKP